jgi:hypothetical protein
MIEKGNQQWTNIESRGIDRNTLNFFNNHWQLKKEMDTILICMDKHSI